MVGVLILSLIWYVAHAHRHYHGPRSTMPPELLSSLESTNEKQEEQDASSHAPE